MATQTFKDFPAGSGTGSEAAENPKIYNLEMDEADSEYFQRLSDNTKKIMVRMRTTSEARMSFKSGDTIVSWITIKPGAVYFDEGLDLTDVRIYLQSSVPSQVAEILEWT